MPYQPNSVLVDNWLLESAALVLRPEGFREFLLGLSQGRPYHPSFADDFPVVVVRQMVDQALQALFHLLDMIVLHEQIVFRAPYSYTWKDRGTLTPLSSVLVEHPVSPGEQDAVDHLDKHVITDNEDSIVANGVRTYLATSSLLGLHYWPCPARAAYLNKVWSQTSTSTPVTPRILATLNREVSRATDEILQALGQPQKPVSFPGFGAAVLADCERSSDVLQAALDFRQSRAARAFRAWCQEMDRALAGDDYATLGRGARDLRTAITDARRSLGLADARSNEPTLSVKLSLPPSPGLSFSPSVVLERARKFRPHIVFLRRHFRRLLAGGSTQAVVRRLFPEIVDGDVLSLRPG